jgi:hypothetical protein
VLLVVVSDDSPYAADMIVEAEAPDEPWTAVLRPSTPWRPWERRRQQRVTLHLKPARAERLSASQRQPLRLLIENLSPQGMGVSSAQALEPGDRLRLTFALSPRAPQLTVSLDVLHTYLRPGPRPLWVAGGKYRESRLARAPLAPAGRRWLSYGTSGLRRVAGPARWPPPVPLCS